MAEEYYRKSFFRLVRCHRDRLSPMLREVIQDPGRRLNDPSCRIIQDNFKSKLGIIRVDGDDLVIKYHHYKNRLHQLRRYFRPTRASKNWYYAHLLRDGGIWVPDPVACIETRIGPLRGESYFIYAYVRGTNGEVYFRRHRRNLDAAGHGMDMVVDLVQRIAAMGLIHGDIRMSNLIFKDGRICLLDLDDIKPRRWYQSARTRERDLRGLIKDIGYNIPAELQQPFLRRLAGRP